MERDSISKKEHCRAVRLTEALDKRLEMEEKKRGFASTSAFVRAAIENELTGKGRADAQLEERVAASFDRVCREVMKLGNAQQTLFAFIDALARMAARVTGAALEARDHAGAGQTASPSLAENGRTKHARRSACGDAGHDESHRAVAANATCRVTAPPGAGKKRANLSGCVRLQLAGCFRSRRADANYSISRKRNFVYGAERGT